MTDDRHYQYDKDKGDIPDQSHECIACDHMNSENFFISV